MYRVLAHIWTLTETGDEVVEYCKNGSLPTKYGGECTIKSDGWCYSEDGKRQIVEFLQKIIPSDGRQRLGIFERIVYIVVRYVEISWKFGFSEVILKLCRI
jgi:hypothetical protein